MKTFFFILITLFVYLLFKNREYYFSISSMRINLESNIEKILVHIVNT